QHALHGRCTGLAQTGVDVALQPAFETETTEALGEVHPGQPPVVLRAPERDRVGRAGIVRSQEVVDERVDLRSVRRNVIAHGAGAYSQLATHSLASAPRRKARQGNRPTMNAPGIS